MRQKYRNYYAPLLWEKVTAKFNAFAKTLDKEVLAKYHLPLTELDIEITRPLYGYFYKQVTGKDHEPVSDNNEIMHKHTFDSHLQTPPTGTASTASLNFYARFIGYESFEDFASKNPADLESIKKEEVTPSHINFWWALLVIPFMVLALYFILKEDKETEKRLLPFDQEKQVYEFIEKAMDAEFKTYQKSPAIDTTLLSKYFDKKCNDYWAPIFRVLTIHHEKKLNIINDGNKSDYKLVDKDIVAVINDTLTVRTEEYWNLLWYHPETMQYDSSRIRKSTFYNTYKIHRKGDELKVVGVKMDSLHRHYDWTKFVK